MSGKIGGAGSDSGVIGDFQYPVSTSHIFTTNSTQNAEFTLSSGTYVFFAIAKATNNHVNQENGVVVSDGSTLTISEGYNSTGTILWSNPSGVTLRVQDLNTDKDLGVIGWRTK